MNNQDVINYIMDTPHNTNPTILKQKLNEQDFENRSDWNQNDSTKADYVKNRPFWQDDGKDVYIIDSQMSFTLANHDEWPYSSFLSETLYTGIEYLSVREHNIFLRPEDCLNEIFTVVWNGIEYKCRASFQNDFLIIGNAGIVYDNPRHYVEPFAIVIDTYDGDYDTHILTLDSSPSHDIKFSYVKEGKIHTIPAKWIPQLVGKTNDFNGEIFNDYENNVASGSSSHAEGGNTTASDYASHSEGSGTTASGYASHAEGYCTVASGSHSHTEGSSTTASGYASHAEGSITRASGSYSHTEGGNTIASGNYSHVEGMYNISDTSADDVMGRKKYAHIVGNGTSNTKRSNAHTLDWEGNAWYQGDVYVHGESQEDGNAQRLVTEQELSEALEEFASSSVQPDWNQTDEASLAFIKNKPFYSDVNILVQGSEIAPPFDNPSITLVGLGYLENRRRRWHENSYFVVEMDGEVEVFDPIAEEWDSSVQGMVSLFGYSGALTVSLHRKSGLNQVHIVVNHKFDCPKQLNAYYLTVTDHRQLPEAFIPSTIARKADIDLKLHKKRDNFVLKDQTTGYQYIVAVDNGNLVTQVRPFEYVIITNPTKTAYTAGQVFDSTGIVIAAQYEDGTCTEVIDYQYYDEPLTAGMESVTITSNILGTQYTVECPITVD